MMAGCKTDNDPGKGVTSAKALTSITVKGVQPDKIPAPITPAQWDDADVYLANLPENVGTVTLPNTAAFTDAVIAAKVSSGATAKYAHGFDVGRSSLPFTSVTTRTFEANQYLFIQVTAKDKSVQYYAFRISTVSSNATLDTVTVAGISASKGNPAATWNGSGIAAGSVSISNQDKTDAPVVAAAEAQGATIKLAKVTGAGAPDFGSATSFTFADADFLYIEVTAADGVTKQVYKVEIWIGRNADLSLVNFVNEDDDIDVDVISLGTGDAALANVIAGTILIRTIPNASGYEITIEPEDPDATIKYVYGDEGVAKTVADIVTAYDDASKPVIIFEDRGILWLEVTAQNQTTKKYYKIQADFRQQANIQAGSIDFTAADPSTDTEWDSVTEVYNIRKILTVADSTATYIEQGVDHPRYTTGTAKLLWDYDGLYARVEVIDPEVTTVAKTSGHHEGDSFELFVNETENVTGSGSAYVTGNAAYGQYRLGANGESSGDPAPVVTAFDSLGRQFAKKVSTSTGSSFNGYIVVIQVPWKNTQGTDYAAGKKIGIELQINACTAGGTRDGVMVWNNVAHSNYQNSTDYGLGTLVGVPPTHAQRPTITAQPQTGVYPNVGDTPADLSVTATVTQTGGTLSYEWFKAASSGAVGTSVGTSQTYTPDTSELGASYYYVEVTHTNTSPAITGRTTATVKSAYALIQVGVSLPSVWAEKVTIVNTSAPVYGFDLDGTAFSSYNRVTVRIKTGADGAINNGRLRIWAPFETSDWTGASRTGGMANAAPAASDPTKEQRLIANGHFDSLTVAAGGDWVEYILPLNAVGALHDDLKALNGIVLLAIAPVPQGGSSGNATYYITDITLDNSTNNAVTPLKALHPEDVLLWQGKGPNYYVTQNGNDVPTRTLGYF